MAASDILSSAPLHEPVVRFRGSHAAIVEGLQRMCALPGQAEVMRRARAGAEAAMALFERQVVPHHVDEEQGLFEAVLRSAAPGAEHEQVAQLVERLVAQHRRIERMWSDLRPAVLAVAAGKDPASPEFEPASARLVKTYLDHVCLEEDVFLPLADAILARNPNHLAALDLTLHLRDLPLPRLAYV